MMRPASLLTALLLALPGAALAGGTSTLPSGDATALTQVRQAALRATNSYWKTHPKQQALCIDLSGEWHTDVVAFPVGRADRLYIFSSGSGFAFQVKGAQATLVWCARALDVPITTWKPGTNVERALVFPLRTVLGQVPGEGALDVYYSSGGQLEVLRRDARGRVVCRRAPTKPVWPRSAFQFDERDTCP